MLIKFNRIVRFVLHNTSPVSLSFMSLAFASDRQDNNYSHETDDEDCPRKTTLSTVRLRSSDNAL